MGSVGQGENAEFFKRVASTYQGFLETKRTLFLETRPVGGGAVVLVREGGRGGDRRRKRRMSEMQEVNVTNLQEGTEGEDDECGSQVCRVVILCCRSLTLAGSLSLKKLNR